MSVCVLKRAVKFAVFLLAICPGMQFGNYLE